MADETKAERKKAKEAKERQGMCRLCGVETTLRDSHIIPRWAFKNASQGPPGSKRELVQIDYDRAHLSLRQHSEYLLCGGCEKRFGDREDYVAPLVSQPNGSFRALRLLRSLATVSYSPVDVRDASALDCEQIAYFATSVLWRAGVSQGRDFGADLTNEDEKAMRHYLLGQADFPEQFHLLVEVLEPRGRPAFERTFTGPQALPRRQDRMPQHLFGLLGFVFVFLPTHLAAASPYWQLDVRRTKCMLVGEFRDLYERLFLKDVASNVRGKLADRRLPGP